MFENRKFEPADDAEWLLFELGGLHRAQVLSTLAAIGLPDQLRQVGVASAADLAQALKCDADDLASLMRAGAGMGCLREESPGRFALTAKGEQLCRDKLGDFATFLGGRTQWNGWPELRHHMREGGDKTPFARAFGSEIYDYMQSDAAAAREYDAAIDAFTRYQAAHVVERLELTAGQCLVDVGGGRGTLLVELLRNVSDARGVLFDLPHVVASVADSLPANIEARGGDFFAAVPSGGDLYFLKHILHNWGDEQATRLLANCREAKAAGGKVVVIDALLYPDNRPDLSRMMDLEMRVLCGGHERRKPELRRLFGDAGLNLERSEELASSTWMFVAS